MGFGILKIKRSEIMKIKKHGKLNQTYSGECQKCGCVVECDKSETTTLIDRETQPGSATQYVKCPECGTNFLWVLQNR